MSKKIKELINKYREKILEIPEISVIYTKYKNKKAELNNNNTSTQNQNKANIKESPNQFTIASFYKTTAVFKQQFSSFQSKISPAAQISAGEKIILYAPSGNHPDPPWLSSAPEFPAA